MAEQLRTIRFTTFHDASVRRDWEIKIPFDEEVEDVYEFVEDQLDEWINEDRRAGAILLREDVRFTRTNLELDEVVLVDE